MKLLVRWALGLLFLMAGRSHFTDPAPFVRIVPPMLPYPEALVYLSGVGEIVGGLGLFVDRLARPAAWMLCVLLAAVFPANIYMAVSGVKFHSFPSQPWMAWARLPLQFVLIAALLWCTR